MNLREKRILLNYELKELVQQLVVCSVEKIEQKGKCTITSIKDKYGRITYHFVESDIISYQLSVSGSKLPTVFGIKVEMPESIKVGEEYNINVSISPDQLGEEGFEKVMFKFKTVLPKSGAIATYKATDSTGTEYTFVNNGTWGPPTGFDMPVDYSATTPWKVTFSESGTYKVQFDLVKVATETSPEQILISSVSTALVSSNN